MVNNIYLAKDQLDYLPLFVIRLPFTPHFYFTYSFIYTFQNHIHDSKPKPQKAFHQKFFFPQLQRILLSFKFYFLFPDLPV